VYAVIRTGNKQYIVTEGEKLRIEKLEAEVGEKVELSDILLVGGEGSVKIGDPKVAGATVTAEVLRIAKAKKVLVYKKKRRKGYEKLTGHRQHFTEVLVKKISA
jgi:large subunit ribosomal protein L21